MKLLLSIPSLAAGGAERQFAALASGLAARGHEVLAVALGRAGAQADSLAGSLGGARLVELGKTSRLDNARVALALAGLLRRETPQVHYAFLPTCCVLGALLQPFFPATRLVLGVRAADARGAGLAGRLLLGLEARLSGRAALVVANSRAGRALCLERGFPAQRSVVVENGVDTARWRPERALGAALRQEWSEALGQGGPPTGPFIGLAARLDPLKDHATFLQAAALLARTRPDAAFVCIGGGPEGYARQLRGQARALGLEGRLVWAGERQDMERVYNALDLLCLSSLSEGLPNVLCEAMSCGVPCVSTAVGDAARVLGGVGLAVPPGDPQALAAGLEALLRRMAVEGPGLSQACRERVLERFSLARLLADTEALLLGLIG